jgi:outer membrane protein assembly factor BamB
MKSAFPGVCLLLLLSGWSSPGASSANWPQFRGADARGSSVSPAPTTWNIETGEHIRWQVDIPGLGHASPIVWEGRVFVTTAVRPGAKAEVKIGVYGDGASYQEKEPHQWRLLCLDKASGRLLWDRLGYEAIPRQERHTKASHCNSTPATDGQRLVAIFGSEGLFCFGMDGTLRWKQDLGPMDAGPWDAPTLQWSFASSPVLHEGKVLVQCDVLSTQFVAAFDAGDGHQLWRTARHEVANWCSPAIAVLPSGTQVVLNGWKEIGGYDLATGKRIWTLSGGGDIPVPTPLIADEFAFFTSAHGKYRPLRAVRLAKANGDVTPAELESTNAAIAWCHPRLGSYMQTPIAVGTNLWSCDWLGVLTCVDARTGALHFSERLGKGGDAFTASGVAAGDQLYFPSEAGQVFVVPTSPTFTVLATNQVGGICLATPAVSDGMILFRTTEKLVAVGGVR